VFMLATPGLTRAGEPVNGILFLCESVRSDALGFMGNPLAHTPNLDRLAAQGIPFENAFTTSGDSASSRHTLFTGRFLRPDDWDESALERMRGRGDWTASPLLDGLSQAGFRVGYVRTEPTVLTETGGSTAAGGELASRRDTPAALARPAVEFLEGPEERPFFLTVDFSCGEQGLSSPPDLAAFAYDEALVGHLFTDERFSRPRHGADPDVSRLPVFLQRSLNREIWAFTLRTGEAYEETLAGYHRMVSEIDSTVGRVLARLKELDLRGDTVVYFASSHGVHLGAMGLGGGWLPHEPVMRIPLLIYDPRIPVSERGRREEMVLLADLAPTVFSLAGVAAPGNSATGFEGKNLGPILRGDPGAEGREAFLFQNRVAPHRIPAAEAVRTKRWKYIRYLNSDPLYEELFDLEADPLERHNLAESEELASVRQMMEEKWGELRKQTGVRPRVE